MFAAALLTACGQATTPTTLPSVNDSPLGAPAAPTDAPTTTPAMDSPIPTPPDQPTEQPTANPRDPASLLITPGPTVEPLATDAASQSEALQNPAVQASVEALEKVLSVPVASITVVSVEPVEWPDGCLGVRLPDTMCTQVIVPGYRVVLEANGQRYTYHTNLNGSQVILAEPRIP